MVNSTQFQARLASDISAIIASSGTVSNSIDTSGTSIVGYILPSSFTGTSITFQVSNDNDTFVELKDTNGNDITHIVAQNTAVAISPLDFAGWRYVKFVSGSTEGAERVINIQTRPL